MNLASQVRNNTFYFGLSTISRLLANALINIVVARNYDLESFGSFASAYTLSMFFMIIADFGFDFLTTLEISRTKDVNLSIRKNLPFKFLFVIIALFSLIITAIILPFSEMTFILIFIFSINMVFTTLLNLAFASFRGLEQFIAEAKISVSSNLFLILLVLAVSFQKVDIYLLAGLVTAVRLIALLAAAYILYKRHSAKFNGMKFDFKKEEMLNMIMYGVFILFGTLYFQIDQILVVLVKGDLYAGYYQAVMKLVVILLILCDVLSGVILPTISRLHAEKKEWLIPMQLFLKVLFYLGMVVSGFVFVFAEDIIRVVYEKNDYLVVVPILRYSSLVIFLRYISEPLAVTLTIIGKQSRRTLIVILLSVTNLVLNLIFLPRYELMGLISVSIFTHALGFAGYLVFSFRYFTRRIFSIPNIASFMLFTTAIVICNLFDNHSEHYITILLFIGAIIFLPISIFSKDEKRKFYAFIGG